MKRRFFATLVLFLFTSAVAVAQCSMCKAVAQTGDGGNKAGGLNDAIIYLMFVPYLLLLLFFRKRIWGFVKEIRSMWG